MPEKKDILKELKEISPAVANLPNNNCLSNPPAGYFSALPDMIMSKISDAEDNQSINPFNSPVTLTSDDYPNMDQASIWGKISKETPLPHPEEQYFKNFKDNVLSQIAKEQETPLLHSDSVSSTPVIPMYTSSRLRVFTKWAAAAAIVILVGVSTLINFQNQPIPSNPVNLTVELPKVTDQELSSFIGAQPHEVMTDAVFANVNPDDIENLFSDINDEEMKLFLKQDRLSNVLNLN